jgi:hypothetical protein
MFNFLFVIRVYRKYYIFFIVIKNYFFLKIHWCDYYLTYKDQISQYNLFEIKMFIILKHVILA